MTQTLSDHFPFPLNFPNALKNFDYFWVICSLFKRFHSSGMIMISARQSLSQSLSLPPSEAPNLGVAFRSSEPGLVVSFILIMLGKEAFEKFKERKSNIMNGKCEWAALDYRRVCRWWSFDRKRTAGRSDWSLNCPVAGLPTFQSASKSYLLKQNSL